MKYVWKKKMAAVLSAALIAASGTASFASEEIEMSVVSDEIVPVSDDIFIEEETDGTLISDEILIEEETEIFSDSEESFPEAEISVDASTEMGAEAVTIDTESPELQIEQIEEIEELRLTAESAEVLYTDGTETFSGTCGDPSVNNGQNVTWSFAVGTLTISGSGDMMSNWEKWEEEKRPGWENHKNEITAVIIKDGVTSIGAAAFYSYEKLESVTIPNSVKNIGSNAFQNSGITSLEIPSGVTSIPEAMCQECSYLTSVTIPETVTKIGNWAFYYCNQLPSVTIPEKVTSIGESAFAYCMALTSVRIPGKVSNIGKRAFGNCNKLSSIYFNGNAPSVDDVFITGNNDYPFMGTVYVSDSELEFTGYNLAPWTNWKIIYLNDVRTAAITLNDNTISVYNGGNEVTPPVQVQIENKILTLNVDYTVSYSNNREVGTASMTITGTGNYEGSVTKEFQIFPVGVGSCGANAAWVLEGNTLRILGTGAIAEFNGNSPWNSEVSKIQHIEIAPGITYLSYAAFAYCENLQTVALYGNAPKIGISVFGDASPQFLVSGINAAGYDDVDWRIFGYTNIIYLNQIRPENVTRIQNQKYSGEPLRPDVTIKDYYGKLLQKGIDYTISYENNVEIGTATAIITGKGNYGGSASVPFLITDPAGRLLDSGTCNSAVSWELDVDGILTISGTGAMPDYDTGEISPWNVYYQNEIRKVVIEEGITTIGNRTFFECFSLENVTLASTVTDIGVCAFFDCTSLKTIDFPNNLEIIKFGAFEASGLAELNLNQNLKIIEDQAFYSCDFKRVSVPAGIERIGDAAFLYCSELEYVYCNGVIPPELGSDVFSNENTIIVVCGKDAAKAGAYSDGKWTAYQVVYQNRMQDILTNTIPDQIYTGEAWKPEITVTDYCGNQLKEGTDYTIAYENNVEIGTASVILTAVDGSNYIGSVTKTFEILPKEFADYVTVSDPENRIYTGAAQIQNLTVKIEETVLKEGTDYTVSYQNNVNAGTATVTISAVEGTIYQGSITKTFKISPKEFASSVTITGLADKNYTGNAQTQTITVKDGSRTLAEGVDYTVSYKNHINVGTATVEITAKGNYTGSIIKTFTILPGETESNKPENGAGGETESGKPENGTGGETESGKPENGTGGETESGKPENGTGSETESGEPENGTGSETESGKPENETGSETESGKPENGTGSETESGEPERDEPDEVSGLRVSKSTAKTITLKWKKVDRADGYTIYRWNSSTKKWKKLATTKKLTYTDKKRSSGKKYKYAVSAYDKKGGKTYRSEKEIIKAATKPAGVKNLKVKKTTKKTVTLSWKKVPNATGYIVYRQNAKSKKWVKLGTTRKLSYTNKKLKAGKNYKYAVKAYISYDGKTYTGTQKTVKAKTKK